MEPAPSRLAICPECGSSSDRTTRPVWSRTLAVCRVIPLSLALLALIGSGVMAWRSLQTDRWGLPGPFAIPRPALAACGQPGITYADLQAIADGRAPVTELAAAFADIARNHLWWADVRSAWLPGSRLYASLCPPNGLRDETRSIGWPSPWIICRTQAQIGDAPDRPGPPGHTWTDAPPSPWSLGGMRHRTIRTTTAPSFSSIHPSPSAIALSVLLLVITWHAAGPASRLVGWLRGRPIRTGRARLAAVALAALAVGATAYATARTSTITNLSRVLYVQGQHFAGMAPLMPSAVPLADAGPFTGQHWQTLLASEAGIRQLAGAICAAARPLGRGACTLFRL